MIRENGEVMVRVWEYDVVETSSQEFERVYGPTGDWAQLFSLAEGYVGTELFESVSRPGRYLTVDRFDSQDAWVRFLAEHRDAYLRLDALSARLTLSERELATQVD